MRSRNSLRARGGRRIGCRTRQPQPDNSTMGTSASPPEPSSEPPPMTFDRRENTTPNGSYEERNECQGPQYENCPGYVVANRDLRISRLGGARHISGLWHRDRRSGPNAEDEQHRGKSCRPYHRHSLTRLFTPDHYPNGAHRAEADGGSGPECAMSTWQQPGVQLWKPRDMRNRQML